MAVDLTPGQLAQVQGVVQQGVQGIGQQVQGLQQQLIGHSQAITDGLKISGGQLEEKFGNMEANLKATFETFNKKQTDMQEKQDGIIAGMSYAENILEALKVENGKSKVTAAEQLEALRVAAATEIKKIDEKQLEISKTIYAELSGRLNSEYQERMKGDGWGKGDEWGKGGKGEWGKTIGTKSPNC